MYMYTYIPTLATPSNLPARLRNKRGKGLKKGRSEECRNEERRKEEWGKGYRENDKE